jgi:hypothetical protein
MTPALKNFPLEYYPDPWKRKPRALISELQIGVHVGLGQPRSVASDPIFNFHRVIQHVQSIQALYLPGIFVILWKKISEN